MKKLKRVVIKEELVELTGDYRPALILNQFIYWTERMNDADKYILEEKERALKEQLEVSIEESKGWIYKTAEELNEELMVGMSKATIGKYIKQLVEAGYLNKRNNPKYKWDKTLQYRVDLVKVQTDLGKLGYALEGYKLLPNIKIIEDVKVDENKEAPTFAEVEADNNNLENLIDDNSIPQNDEKYTQKEKENMESIPKSEVAEVIRKSCVNIKKEDLKDCEEEFTDIDKLKEALTICEVNNSHGIKALRMAYKYGNINNSKSNKKESAIFMADSKVNVNGTLKSVGDMTKEEFEQKLKAKWGDNHIC